MKVRTNARTSVWNGVPPVWVLPALLVVGLLIRLPFLGDDGFKADVQTFEAWAIALVDHGFANFYAQAGFADYPPGYFYILAVVGAIWDLFRAHDPGFGILKVLVKLPAVLADLGIGYLLYLIGTRFARPALGLAAAALYVLNPATIFISAKWGQVDAVAGSLALLAVYFLIRSDDTEPERPSWWIVGAWIAFGYSLLIKPQAAVLGPIFIAFAFADASRMKARLAATVAGAACALMLAIGLAEPFHPSNPIAAFVWLLGRYTFASSVYSYNSVNAFDLWAIKGQFWQPDSQTILFLPQYVWGVLLVIAAVALVIWRYLQERTAGALLESCAIALLAFFVLATRMHERYVFNALLFCIACVPFARRYLYVVVALSVVLFANLVYSLQYLNAMTDKTPNVDPHNLWGIWTSLLSIVAVGTFFAIGYAFLGSTPAEPVAEPAPSPQRPERTAPSTPLREAAPPGPRQWFDPREGLRAFKAPLDYVVMGALGLFSFVLSFVGYWNPPEKIFDEIYFARAAEEYLQNLRIYESTHPPLSKLLVTLSVMLFGGMPHGHGLGGWTGLNAIVGHLPNGDNAFGWRFLDVVFGALVVMLLFAFAKRVTGSTVFGAIAALFLTFDGMHFVQSRIATPEGLVIFFALFAAYAFYRFWIASQVEERPHVTVPAWGFAAAVGASVLGGIAVVAVWKAMWPPLEALSMTIVALYVALGLYLLFRYVLFVTFFGDGRRELTFAEGSHAIADPANVVVYAADGGVLDTSAKNVQRGALSQNRGGSLVYEGGDVTVTYGRDAAVTYESPDGSATYANDEIRSDGNVERGRAASMWLLLFTLALGALVSSKWYGVMGFGVSFIVLIALWLQRYVLRGRLALWGNPRGFRLDGTLVMIAFVAASVYALAWTPDLLRHGQQADVQNFNDVVHMQNSMYSYHANLTATHPYASKWWEWPFDYVPVAYYYQDHRKNPADEHGCCVTEVTSMPNPFILWFGLLTVPLVGYLAWKERRKGYALIVLTYLLQWLPWARSPRIAWEYHFYVNIPLICLCNAIVLQRIWEWGTRREGAQGRWLGGIAVGAYVALVAFGFMFFYPVLAAQPIPWDAWHHRMWIDKWVVGPG